MASSTHNPPSPLPTTMRTAVLGEPRAITVEERPVPSPAAGEVLIEVLAVGVCGSDIHYYEHGRIGDLVVRSPLVLGHEASGRVVALGDGVRSLAVGDRVALEPGVPCGACRECRSGRYNLCPDVRFFATPPIDGTFAEFVTLPADFAHRVPDSLSDVEAALIEPLSVGLWSNQKADVGPGDTVLVTGAGADRAARTAGRQGARGCVRRGHGRRRYSSRRRFGTWRGRRRQRPDERGEPCRPRAVRVDRVQRRAVVGRCRLARAPAGRTRRAGRHVRRSGRVDPCRDPAEP